MSIWLIAAVALLLAIVPCGFAILRAPLMDALVALQFGTSIGVTALVLMAVGAGRPSFLDIALTLALLAYPATLVFAHFLERWL